MGLSQYLNSYNSENKIKYFSYLNPSLESNCFQHVINHEVTTQFLERNMMRLSNI